MIIDMFPDIASYSLGAKLPTIENHCHRLKKRRPTGFFFGGGKKYARVWDGNVKLGCDDGCTTINIVKFIELKKEDLNDT